MILKSRYAWNHYPDMNTIYRNMTCLLGLLSKRGIEREIPDFDKGLKLASQLLEDEIRHSFHMPLKKRKYTVYVFHRGDIENAVHTCTITTHRSMVDALEDWVKDNPEYQEKEKYTWSCWMEVEDAENKTESEAS